MSTDTVLGVDFSCAPTRRKPITAAWGLSDGQIVRLHSIQDLTSLPAFEQMLIQPPPTGKPGWVGGFDFPFGLPRVFIDALNNQAPPNGPISPMVSAAELIAHLHTPHTTTNIKAQFQQLVDGWGTSWGGNTRPAKLPHRQTDRSMPGISSTSPLQTRYVPVGKMYIEGFWRLVQAPINVPVLRTVASSQCHALEAYPALLAHEVLRKNAMHVSYKNDAPGAPDPQRLLNRLTLIDRLEQGQTRLSLRLKLTPAQRDYIAQDTQGDRLDAVLCLMQAAWAARENANGASLFGLPPQTDPLEGWILTVSPQPHLEHAC